MKNQNQYEATFPVYKVTSHGVAIEYTPDRKGAEQAFKDGVTEVSLWEVQESGEAKLLMRK